MSLHPFIAITYIEKFFIAITYIEKILYCTRVTRDKMMLVNMAQWLLGLSIRL